MKKLCSGRTGCLFFAAFLAASGVQRAGASPTYSITDLGTLPGGSAYSATSINSSGQVVGTYIVGQTQQYFLYENGTMTQIPQSGQSLGISINDSGQVGPVGINNSGQTIDNQGGQAILSSGATTTNLGAGTTAFGLNDAGQVVGTMPTLNGNGEPFLYSNGRLIDLGLPAGADGGSANAINNNGQIVGGGFNGISHAWLYSDGKFTDLGTLGGLNGEANGINSSGLIVGYSELQDRSIVHAFVYQNGQMLDLNNLIPVGSGWVLSSAGSVNASGLIVGDGYYDGEQRAFLLTPSNASPVPEPGSLYLTAGMIAALGAFKAWRKRSSS